MKITAVQMIICLVLSACGGGGSSGPGGPAPIASVEIFDTVITLTAIESSHQYSAVVRDSNGVNIPNTTIVWSSSDTDVATVDLSGLAVARGVGEVQIQALASGKSDTTTLTVMQAIVSVDISPVTTTLGSVGATLMFQAVPRDANDYEVASAIVTWQSSDPSVVSVDANGLATAIALGTADIVASADGVSASALVSIVLPGPYTLTPIDWRMPVSSQVPFTVAHENDGTEIFDWSVNGVPGGSPNIGTIDADGLYVAPTGIPAVNPVIIRAALNSDPTHFVEAPVTIELDSQATTIDWSLWTPRALISSTNAPVKYEVGFTGYPAVRIERPNGSVVALNPVRSGVYAVEFPTSELVQGYTSGDLHNFAGFLLCDNCDRISRGNLHVNVKDNTVPDVSVTQLASDVQASEHVVNISFDSLFPRTNIPVEALAKFYAFFPDEYDFIAVIEQVTSFNNRSYRRVQNDTSGIGTALFDNSGFWGSQGRLKGIIDFPRSNLFDAAATSMSHEIGHRWMSFLDNPVLVSGVPHWPISDIAIGIMGYSGAGRQGSHFPFSVIPVSGDIHQMVNSSRSREFNDLELYLIGLIPDSEVPTYVVFRDQGIPVTAGSQGEVDTITIQEIIAVNGPRVPDSLVSQKDFGLGTIVLSQGRMLSAGEMAFFDHMAARGEANTELFFTEGFSSGFTKPFFLATGQRATLTTKLLP
jgi:hypothetical protein